MADLMSMLSAAEGEVVDQTAALLLPSHFNFSLGPSQRRLNQRLQPQSNGSLLCNNCVFDC